MTEQECMHRPVIRDGDTICQDCGETLCYGSVEDNDGEVEDRIAAHERYLASAGADHLFEGRGE